MWWCTLKVIIIIIIIMQQCRDRWRACPARVYVGLTNPAGRLLCVTPKRQQLSLLHLPSAKLRPRSADQPPSSWRRSNCSQRAYQCRTCTHMYMSRKIRGNKSLITCSCDRIVRVPFPRHTITGPHPFTSCTGWTHTTHKRIKLLFDIFSLNSYKAKSTPYQTC
jgi:hypothetical protein